MATPGEMTSIHSPGEADARLETAGRQPQIRGLARVPNTHRSRGLQPLWSRDQGPFRKCHFRHDRLLTPQNVAPITRLTAEDCGAARRQGLTQTSEITKQLAI